MWVANTYTIAYSSNATDATGSMSTTSATYDSSVTLRANAFSRTGYTFSGWNTASNGSGTSYSNQASVSNLTSTNNGTVTLYAQWTPNIYAITLNQNNGSGGTTTIYEKYNTGWYSDSSATTSISSVTMPTRSNYTVLGYYNSTSGTTQYIPAGGSLSILSTTTFSSATTIYAQWTPNIYKITLDKNGATTAGTTAIYEKYATGWYSNSNATTSITSITTPSKTGYQFKGYYNSASGTTQYIPSGGSLSNLSNSTFSAAATIYAQ